MSYIRLDRKMLTWEWKDDPNMVALWIEILLQANWEDRSWHGETFQAGTFPTSISRLAKGSGLSVQSVRTCLKRLENTQEITIESTSQGTKISVVKWAEYQGNDEGTNTVPNKRLTSDQQASNKRSTTLKEIKEIKERKNNKSKGFNEALDAFAEMRKTIKKPLTEKAEKMILNKLEELSNDEETQIKILDQSTINCWQSVYPLKEEPQPDTLPTYDTSKNKTYTEDEEEELMKMIGGPNYEKWKREHRRTE